MEVFVYKFKTREIEAFFSVNILMAYYLFHIYVSASNLMDYRHIVAYLIEEHMNQNLKICILHLWIVYSELFL